MASNANIPSSLFEPVPLSRGPQQERESDFEFLERNSLPFFADIRRVLDQWYAAFGAQDGSRPNAKVGLRGHFRSQDQRKFFSAFWELYLHQVLVTVGARPIVEPDLGTTRRHIDFAAFDSTLLIEATVAGNAADEQVTASNRAMYVRDALKSYVDERFLFGGVQVVPGRDSVRVAEVMGALRQWLAELPEREVRHENARGLLKEAPRFKWRDAKREWLVSLYVYPKPPGMENRPSYASPAVDFDYVGQRAPGIADALKEKANAYGEQHRPLIIAIMDVLAYKNDFEIAMAEMPPNVAGVLGAWGLHPLDAYKWVEGSWAFWANPQFKGPRPEVPFPLSVDDGHTSSRSRPMTELLGLRANWPDAKPPWQEWTAD